MPQKKQTVAVKKTKKSKSSATINKEVISALSKISEAITSDFYPDDILKLIVTITAEVMDAKICSLLLPDPKTNELAVKATQSVSENYNKKPNLKYGEGIAGHVMKEAKHIAVSDISKDKRYVNREIALKEKLKSLLSVPLIYKGNVIGVLNCYTEKLHTFTKSEINVVKSVATQASIVIENFRLIVESKVIKEELEIRKIVEKAKGILMKQKGMTEQEAYNKMRKYSMDNRKSMREIAEGIIMTEEMK